MTDFRSLIRTLCEHHVEFIVIGGAAATAHGSTRLTLDLDIVYRRTPQNLSGLVLALSPYKPYLRGSPKGLPFLWDATTIARGLNFTLTTELGDIDIFGEITGGGGFDQLLPHTVLIKLFGLDCLLLDLDELIRVKRAAGRPKDFESIAELEAIAEGSATPSDDPSRNS